MSYYNYVHFSEVWIKAFIISLQGFREKGSFSSQLFQVKSRRKIRNVRLENCHQVTEETRRISDSVQFTGGKQNLKDNKTNIHKYYSIYRNLFSLSTIIPIFTKYILQTN